MQRKLIVTGDGSHSFELAKEGLTYHSRNGAVAESSHIFIRHGFESVSGQEPLHIFEMGFGTGLNAFLTLLEAARLQRRVHYTSIDTVSIPWSEVAQLNYPALLGHPDYWNTIHQSTWDEPVQIHEFFTLEKKCCDLRRFVPQHRYHLIYFDAFAPAAQPELWTTEIFTSMAAMLCEGGLLLTYSSKGSVRRMMEAAGLAVEKLPGPAGKREIVRAAKISVPAAVADNLPASVCRPAD
jgi:tRNA U34 5-methylaminomethyl-2-thiouridine-forming methyltransferase MnmC